MYLQIMEHYAVHKLFVLQSEKCNKIHFIGMISWKAAEHHVKFLMLGIHHSQRRKSQWLLLRIGTLQTYIFPSLDKDKQI